MDPATLVGIGSSLLSGIFGASAAKRERAQSLDDVENQFVRLRAGAEKAGYNPLSVLGTASGIPAPGTSGASYMGQAIADTGLMLADSLAKTQSAQTLSRSNALESQNASLLDRLTRATLRPKVGGVYEQRDSVPSYAAALGGQHEDSVPYPNFGSPPFGPVRGSRVFSGLENAAASNDATAPPVKPLTFFGKKLWPSNLFSDASAAEARYSEAGGLVFGIPAMIYDFGWNIGRIAKNRSFDPIYRDVGFGDPGGPAARKVRAQEALAARRHSEALSLAPAKSWVKYDYFGPGARNQDF